MVRMFYENKAMRRYPRMELAYFLQYDRTRDVAYSIVPRDVIVALHIDGYIN
jgi:hypothetical protein